MTALRLVTIFVLLVCTSVAHAERRVALVIGNSVYTHASKLPNPVNDAADIGASLKRLGFDVTVASDLSFDAMRRQLGAFTREANGADMAVIFYAGHGMEVKNQNYLIPTDAKLETDLAISFETIPLELATQAVAGAKGLKLVMLDACRNNPFAAAMEMTNPTRSIGRGLARIEPVDGTLVTYAAKEGTVADDGNGRNSPYTRALLEHLEQPGLEISFLFRKVRDRVREQTNNRQTPFVYGSLPGEQIFLAGPSQENASEKPSNNTTLALRKELDDLRKQLQAAERKSSQDAAQRESGIKEQREADEFKLFIAARDSSDPAALEEYLKAYPNGRFTAMARVQIEQLKNRKANSSQNGAKAKEIASAARKPEAPTVTSKPKRISQIRAWGAYSVQTSKGQTCYVLSMPTRQEPSKLDHGNVFLTLAKHPKGQNFEPQLKVGYEFARDSVSMSIDGSSFELFTRGNSAWMKNPAEEAEVVEKMKKGRQVTISAKSQRGTSTRYVFSLSGVTATVSLADKCL